MDGNPCKSYSNSMDGNKMVSTNFRVREFACQDGSDPVFIADKLVQILQAIRNHFGQPVNITSGYRTAAHNRAVGGVTTSLHLYGMAADIMVVGVKPGDVADYVELLMPNTGGIGRYKDFTHIDVRNTKSRFVG